MNVIETMKQALEALELAMYPQVKQLSAITNLRAAIKAMEDAEPVAWMTNESVYRLKKDGGNSKGAVPVHRSGSAAAKIPLYTHPAPAVPEGEKK